MATINGDWFHSRSSSNLTELLTVRRLVLESQRPEYIGFGWSGGRYEKPQMHQFAAVADIKPSTMQTKIRTMIRYGFIRDSNQCPLIWTRMGSLWNDLYTVGNYNAAQEIYKLTLAISLAIYAFNNTSEQFSINPRNGELPLKFLLNILDDQNSISLQEFEFLVDGHATREARNISYWKGDLINSGLFREEHGRLYYTDKYFNFVQEVRTFEPDPLLNDEEWQAIRDNPLIEISPFRNSIRAILEGIIGEQNIEDQVTDEIITDPLVDIIAEQEEIQIPEVDILSNALRYSQSTRRVRNTTWAIRIKKRYNCTCTMPRCDVRGEIFVEAAHIKPDNAPNSNTPHRAHILNGLCLCRHCHIAFDRGYFSLTDDYRIITSSQFNDIPNQNLKTAIWSSINIQIKQRTDNRLPLVEFIQYHRTNRFKN